MRPNGKRGDTLRVFCVGHVVHDLFVEFGPAAWHALESILEGKAAVSLLEIRGECDALKVGSGIESFLDESYAFEENEVGLGSRANAAESLDQRILPAGDLLYEHRLLFY